jgi:hypothetical protein
LTREPKAEKASHFENRNEQEKRKKKKKKKKTLLPVMLEKAFLCDGGKIVVLSSAILLNRFSRISRFSTFSCSSFFSVVFDGTNTVRLMKKLL